MGFAHVESSPLTRSSYHARGAAAAAAATARHRAGAAAARRSMGRHDRPARRPRRTARSGCGHAWASSGSTRCSCRTAPTCPGSRATGPCPSSGSPSWCCPGRARPVLLVPALEAPRVPDTGGMITLRPWAETEDPVALAAALLAPGAGRHLWDLGPGLGPLAAGAAGAPARRALEGGVEGHLPAAGREGRRARSRRCGPRRRPPTAWRRCSRTGEIPLAGRQRDPGVRGARAWGCWRRGIAGSTSPSWAAGPTGPAPTTSRASGSSERGDTVVCDFGGEYVLRRRRRLLLGHHPHRGGGGARRRGARRPTPCCWPRSRPPWTRCGPGSPPSTSTPWPGP